MPPVLIKILRLVTVLLIVTTFAFLMINSLPGNVAYLLAGGTGSAEDILALEKELGLDRPLIVRYLSWLGGLLQGDWGVSALTQEPNFGLPDGGIYFYFRQ